MEQVARMSDAKPAANFCSLEIDGAVARLTLRRSDVFNALNVQLISEMVEALSWTAKRSVGATQSLLDANGAPIVVPTLVVPKGEPVRLIMQSVDVSYAEEWKFDHGIMVPLNHRLTLEELTHVFRDSGPTILLFDDAHRETACILAELDPDLTLIDAGEGADSSNAYERLESLWENWRRDLDELEEIK